MRNKEESRAIPRFLDRQLGGFAELEKMDGRGTVKSEVPHSEQAASAVPVGHAGGGSPEQAGGRHRTWLWGDAGPRVRVGISTSRQTQFFKNAGMDGVIGGGVQGWGPRTTFWRRPVL